MPPNKLGGKENDQVRPDRANCRLFNGTVFFSVKLDLLKDFSTYQASYLYLNRSS